MGAIILGSHDRPNVSANQRNCPVIKQFACEINLSWLTANRPSVTENICFCDAASTNCQMMIIIQCDTQNYYINLKLIEIQFCLHVVFFSNANL